MILTALTGLLISAFAQTTTAPKAADAPKVEWKLVWSDEFDGKSLDAGKWRVEDLAPLKNQERQYYAPANATVEGGNLVLLSEEKASGGRPYTSAQIDTHTKYARAFGRFEARMKLPKTKGIWPAFWLLPADGRWPPEIDIMELLGHEPNTVYMTTHWGVFPGNQHGGSPFVGPDFSADFRTFSCDWFPDHIDFMVDGVKRYTAPKEVPQDPMYVIFNVAVGGDWPGFPDKSTVFPQKMLVDYVRVYEPVEAARKYLSINASHGTVKATPAAYVFKTGESVSLTASPEFGWRFVRWEDAGDQPATQATAKVLMSENRNVRAIFEIDPNAPKLLSLGKPVTVSSTQGTEFPAKAATDGNPASRWASEFSDPQWIHVDLGSTRKIKVVRLIWEAAYAKHYTIGVSDDAKAWRTVHTQQAGHGGDEILTLDAAARYVRVNGLTRATQFGYSLFELSVYGE